MDCYQNFPHIQTNNQIYFVDHAQDLSARNNHQHTANTQNGPNRADHQHHKMSDNFIIQPTLSDQYFVTYPQQYNYQHPIDHSDELDLHLIKEKQQFIQYTVKSQSDGLNIHHTISPTHFDNLPKIQDNGQVYQVIDETTPHHYSYPQAHAELTHSPYITHQKQPQVYLPEIKQNEIIFLPPVDAQLDHQVYHLDNQTRQYQIPNTKPATQVETTMEFVKKGPRGEVLYKMKEGPVTSYVKRGLTPEAVYNYQLAHIIGVGPPVETIETDGLKMEEGVCLRQAVREKLITVDEAFRQIQVLHRQLFDANMAHCDVKFENCLYFPRYQKVLLIDNGDLSAYGNPRKIKTEGMNSTLLISPYGHDEKNKVGPATDLQGFIHIMFNAVHEPIDA